MGRDCRLGVQYDVGELSPGRGAFVVEKAFRATIVDAWQSGVLLVGLWSSLLVRRRAGEQAPESVGAQGGNVGTLDGSVAWKDIRHMKLYRSSQLWESDGAFGYW